MRVYSLDQSPRIGAGLQRGLEIWSIQSLAPLSLDYSIADETRNRPINLRLGVVEPVFQMYEKPTLAPAAIVLDPSVRGPGRGEDARSLRHAPVFYHDVRAGQPLDISDGETLAEALRSLEAAYERAAQTPAMLPRVQAVRMLSAQTARLDPERGALDPSITRETLERVAMAIPPDFEARLEEDLSAKQDPLVEDHAGAPERLWDEKLRFAGGLAVTKTVREEEKLDRAYRKVVARVARDPIGSRQVVEELGDGYILLLAASLTDDAVSDLIMQGRRVYVDPYRLIKQLQSVLERIERAYDAPRGERADAWADLMTTLASGLNRLAAIARRAGHHHLARRATELRKRWVRTTNVPGQEYVHAAGIGALLVMGAQASGINWNLDPTVGWSAPPLPIVDMVHKADVYLRNVAAVYRALRGVDKSSPSARGAANLIVATIQSLGGHDYQARYAAAQTYYAALQQSVQQGGLFGYKDVDVRLEDTSDEALDKIAGSYATSILGLPVDWWRKPYKYKMFWVQGLDGNWRRMGLDAYDRLRTRAIVNRLSKEASAVSRYTEQVDQALTLLREMALKAPGLIERIRDEVVKDMGASRAISYTLSPSGGVRSEVFVYDPLFKLLDMLPSYEKGELIRRLAFWGEYQAYAGSLINGLELLSDYLVRARIPADKARKIKDAALGLRKAIDRYNARMKRDITPFLAGRAYVNRLPATWMMWNTIRAEIDERSTVSRAFSGIGKHLALPTAATEVMLVRPIASYVRSAFGQRVPIAEDAANRQMTTTLGDMADMMLTFGNVLYHPGAGAEFYLSAIYGPQAPMHVMGYYAERARQLGFHPAAGQMFAAMLMSMQDPLTIGLHAGSLLMAPFTGGGSLAVSAARMALPGAARMGTLAYRLGRAGVAPLLRYRLGAHLAGLGSALSGASRLAHLGLTYGGIVSRPIWRLSGATALRVMGDIGDYLDALWLGGGDIPTLLVTAAFDYPRYTGIYSQIRSGGIGSYIGSQMEYLLSPTAVQMAIGIKQRLESIAALRTVDPDTANLMEAMARIMPTAPEDFIGRIALYKTASGVKVGYITRADIDVGNLTIAPLDRPSDEIQVSASQTLVMPLRWEPDASGGGQMRSMLLDLHAAMSRDKGDLWTVSDRLKLNLMAPLTALYHAARLGIRQVPTDVIDALMNLTSSEEGPAALSMLQDPDVPIIERQGDNYRITDAGYAFLMGLFEPSPSQADQVIARRIAKTSLLAAIDRRLAPIERKAKQSGGQVDLKDPKVAALYQLRGLAQIDPLSAALSDKAPRRVRTLTRATLELLKTMDPTQKRRIAARIQINELLGSLTHEIPIVESVRAAVKDVLAQARKEPRFNPVVVTDESTGAEVSVAFFPIKPKTDGMRWVLADAVKDAIAASDVSGNFNVYYTDDGNGSLVVAADRVLTDTEIEALDRAITSLWGQLSVLVEGDEPIRAAVSETPVQDIRDRDFFTVATFPGDDPSKANLLADLIAGVNAEARVVPGMNEYLVQVRAEDQASAKSVVELALKSLEEFNPIVAARALWKERLRSGSAQGTPTDLQVRKLMRDLLNRLSGDLARLHYTPRGLVAKVVSALGLPLNQLGTRDQGAIRRAAARAAAAQAPQVPKALGFSSRASTSLGTDSAERAYANLQRLLAGAWSTIATLRIGSLTEPPHKAVDKELFPTFHRFLAATAQTAYGLGHEYWNKILSTWRDTRALISGDIAQYRLFKAMRQVALTDGTIPWDAVTQRIRKKDPELAQWLTDIATELGLSAQEGLITENQTLSYAVSNTIAAAAMLYKIGMGLAEGTDSQTAELIKHAIREAALSAVKAVKGEGIAADEAIEAIYALKPQTLLKGASVYASEEFGVSVPSLLDETMRKMDGILRIHVLGPFSGVSWSDIDELASGVLADRIDPQEFLEKTEGAHDVSLNRWSSVYLAPLGSRMDVRARAGLLTALDLYVRAKFRAAVSYAKQKAAGATIKAEDALEEELASLEKADPAIAKLVRHIHSIDQEITRIRSTDPRTQPLFERDISAIEQMMDGLDSSWSADGDDGAIAVEQANREFMFGYTALGDLAGTYSQGRSLHGILQWGALLDKYVPVIKEIASSGDPHRVVEVYRQHGRAILGLLGDRLLFESGQISAERVLSALEDLLVRFIQSDTKSAGAIRSFYRRFGHHIQWNDLKDYQRFAYEIVGALSGQYDLLVTLITQLSKDYQYGAYDQPSFTDPASQLMLLMGLLSSKRMGHTLPARPVQSDEAGALPVQYTIGTAKLTVDREPPRIYLATDQPDTSLLLEEMLHAVYLRLGDYERALIDRAISESDPSATFQLARSLRQVGERMALVSAADHRIGAPENVRVHESAVRSLALKGVNDVFGDGHYDLSIPLLALGTASAMRDIFELGALSDDVDTRTIAHVLLTQLRLSVMRPQDQGYALGSLAIRSADAWGFSSQFRVPPKRGTMAGDSGISLSIVRGQDPHTGQIVVSLEDIKSALQKVRGLEKKDIDAVATHLMRVIADPSDGSSVPSVAFAPIGMWEAVEVPDIGRFVLATTRSPVMNAFDTGYVLWVAKVSDAEPQSDTLKQTESLLDWVASVTIRDVQSVGMPSLTDDETKTRIAYSIASIAAALSRTYSYPSDTSFTEVAQDIGKAIEKAVLSYINERGLRFRLGPAPRWNGYVRVKIGQNTQLHQVTVSVEGDGAVPTVTTYVSQQLAFPALPEHEDLVGLPVPPGTILSDKSGGLHVVIGKRNDKVVLIGAGERPVPVGALSHIGKEEPIYTLEVENRDISSRPIIRLRDPQTGSDSVGVYLLGSFSDEGAARLAAHWAMQMISAVIPQDSEGHPTIPPATEVVPIGSAESQLPFARPLLYGIRGGRVVYTFSGDDVIERLTSALENAAAALESVAGGLVMGVAAAPTQENYKKALESHAIQLRNAANSIRGMGLQTVHLIIAPALYELADSFDLTNDRFQGQRYHKRLLSILNEMVRLYRQQDSASHSSDWLNLIQDLSSLEDTRLASPQVTNLGLEPWNLGSLGRPMYPLPNIIAGWHWEQIFDAISLAMEQMGVRLMLRGPYYGLARSLNPSIKRYPIPGYSNVIRAMVGQDRKFVPGKLEDHLRSVWDEFQERALSVIRTIGNLPGHEMINLVGDDQLREYLLNAAMGIRGDYAPDVPQGTPAAEKEKSIVPQVSVVDQPVANLELIVYSVMGMPVGFALALSIGRVESAKDDPTRTISKHDTYFVSPLFLDYETIGLATSQPSGQIPQTKETVASKIREMLDLTEYAISSIREVDASAIHNDYEPVGAPGHHLSTLSRVDPRTGHYGHINSYESILRVLDLIQLGVPINTIWTPELIIGVGPESSFQGAELFALETLESGRKAAQVKSLRVDSRTQSTGAQILFTPAPSAIKTVARLQEIALANLIIGQIYEDDALLTMDQQYVVDRINQVIPPSFEELGEETKVGLGDVIRQLVQEKKMSRMDAAYLVESAMRRLANTPLMWSPYGVSYELHRQLVNAYSSGHADSAKVAAFGIARILEQTAKMASMDAIAEITNHANNFGVRLDQLLEVLVLPAGSAIRTSDLWGGTTISPAGEPFDLSNIAREVYKAVYELQVEAIGGAIGQRFGDFRNEIESIKQKSVQKAGEAIKSDALSSDWDLVPDATLASILPSEGFSSALQAKRVVYGPLGAFETPMKSVSGGQLRNPYALVQNPYSLTPVYAAGNLTELMEGLASLQPVDSLAAAGAPELYRFIEQLYLIRIQKGKMNGISSDQDLPDDPRGFTEKLLEDLLNKADQIVQSNGNDAGIAGSISGWLFDESNGVLKDLAKEEIGQLKRGGLSDAVVERVASLLYAVATAPIQSQSDKVKAAKALLWMGRAYWVDGVPIFKNSDNLNERLSNLVYAALVSPSADKVGVLADLLADGAKLFIHEMRNIGNDDRSELRIREPFVLGADRLHQSVNAIQNALRSIAKSRAVSPSQVFNNVNEIYDAYIRNVYEFKAFTGLDTDPVYDGMKNATSVSLKNNQNAPLLSLAALAAISIDGLGRYLSASRGMAINDRFGASYMQLSEDPARRAEGWMEYNPRMETEPFVSSMGSFSPDQYPASLIDPVRGTINLHAPHIQSLDEARHTYAATILVNFATVLKIINQYNQTDNTSLIIELSGRLKDELRSLGMDPEQKMLSGDNRSGVEDTSIGDLLRKLASNPANSEMVANALINIAQYKLRSKVSYGNFQYIPKMGLIRQPLSTSSRFALVRLATQIGLLSYHFGLGMARLMRIMVSPIKYYTAQSLTAAFESEVLRTVGVSSSVAYQRPMQSLAQKRALLIGRSIMGMTHLAIALDFGVLTAALAYFGTNPIVLGALGIMVANDLIRAWMTRNSLVRKYRLSGKSHRYGIGHTLSHIGEVALSALQNDPNLYYLNARVKLSSALSMLAQIEHELDSLYRSLKLPSGARDEAVAGTYEPVLGIEGERRLLDERLGRPLIWDRLRRSPGAAALEEQMIRDRIRNLEEKRREVQDEIERLQKGIANYVSQSVLNEPLIHLTDLEGANLPLVSRDAIEQTAAAHVLLKHITHTLNTLHMITPLEADNTAYYVNSDGTVTVEQISPSWSPQAPRSPVILVHQRHIAAKSLSDLISLTIGSHRFEPALSDARRVAIEHIVSGAPIQIATEMRAELEAASQDVASIENRDALRSRLRASVEAELLNLMRARNYLQFPIRGDYSDLYERIEDAIDSLATLGSQITGDTFSDDAQLVNLLTGLSAQFNNIADIFEKIRKGFSRGISESADSNVLIQDLTAWFLSYSYLGENSAVKRSLQQLRSDLNSVRDQIASSRTIYELAPLIHQAISIESSLTLLEQMSDYLEGASPYLNRIGWLILPKSLKDIESLITQRPSNDYKGIEQDKPLTVDTSLWTISAIVESGLVSIDPKVMRVIAPVAARIRAVKSFISSVERGEDIRAVLASTSDPVAHMMDLILDQIQVESTITQDDVDQAIRLLEDAGYIRVVRTEHGVEIGATESFPVSEQLDEMVFRVGDIRQIFLSGTRAKDPALDAQGRDEGLLGVAYPAHYWLWSVMIERYLTSLSETGNAVPRWLLVALKETLSKLKTAGDEVRAFGDGGDPRYMASYDQWLQRVDAILGQIEALLNQAGGAGQDYNLPRQAWELVLDAQALGIGVRVVRPADPQGRWEERTVVWSPAMVFADALEGSLGLRDNNQIYTVVPAWLSDLEMSDSYDRFIGSGVGDQGHQDRVKDVIAQILSGTDVAGDALWAILTLMFVRTFIATPQSPDADGQTPTLIGSLASIAETMTTTSAQITAPIWARNHVRSSLGDTAIESDYRYMQERARGVVAVYALMLRDLIGDKYIPLSDNTAEGAHRILKRESLRMIDSQYLRHMLRLRLATDFVMRFHPLGGGFAASQKRHDLAGRLIPSIGVFSESAPLIEEIASILSNWEESNRQDGRRSEAPKIRDLQERLMGAIPFHYPIDEVIDLEYKYRTPREMVSGSFFDVLRSDPLSPYLRNRYPLPPETGQTTEPADDSAQDQAGTDGQPQVVSEHLPEVIETGEKVRLYKLRVGRVVRGLVSRRITLSDYYTVPVILETRNVVDKPEGGKVVVTSHNLSGVILDTTELADAFETSKARVAGGLATIRKVSPRGVSVPPPEGQRDTVEIDKSRIVEFVLDQGRLMVDHPYDMFYDTAHETDRLSRHLSFLGFIGGVRDGRWVSRATLDAAKHRLLMSYDRLGVQSERVEVKIVEALNMTPQEGSISGLRGLYPFGTVYDDRWSNPFGRFMKALLHMLTLPERALRGSFWGRIVEAMVPIYESIYTAMTGRTPSPTDRERFAQSAMRTLRSLTWTAALVGIMLGTPFSILGLHTTFGDVLGNRDLLTSLLGTAGSVYLTTRFLFQAVATSLARYNRGFDSLKHIQQRQVALAAAPTIVEKAAAEYTDLKTHGALVAEDMMKQVLTTYFPHMVGQVEDRIRAQIERIGGADALRKISVNLSEIGPTRGDSIAWGTDLTLAGTPVTPARKPLTPYDQTPSPETEGQWEIEITLGVDDFIGAGKLSNLTSEEEGKLIDLLRLLVERYLGAWLKESFNERMLAPEAAPYLTGLDTSTLWDIQVTADERSKEIKIQFKRKEGYDENFKLTHLVHLASVWASGLMFDHALRTMGSEGDAARDEILMDLVSKAQGGPLANATRQYRDRLKILSLLHYMVGRTILKELHADFAVQRWNVDTGSGTGTLTTELSWRDLMLAVGVVRSQLYEDTPTTAADVEIAETPYALFSEIAQIMTAILHEGGSKLAGDENAMLSRTLELLGITPVQWEALPVPAKRYLRAIAYDLARNQIAYLRLMEYIHMAVSEPETDIAETDGSYNLSNIFLHLLRAYRMFTLQDGGKDKDYLEEVQNAIKLAKQQGNKRWLVVEITETTNNTQTTHKYYVSYDWLLDPSRSPMNQVYKAVQTDTGIVIEPVSDDEFKNNLARVYEVNEGDFDTAREAFLEDLNSILHEDMITVDLVGSGRQVTAPKEPRLAPMRSVLTKDGSVRLQASFLYVPDGVSDPTQITDHGKRGSLGALPALYAPYVDELLERLDQQDMFTRVFNQARVELGIPESLWLDANPDLIADLMSTDLGVMIRVMREIRSEALRLAELGYDIERIQKTLMLSEPDQSGSNTDLLVITSSLMVKLAEYAARVAQLERDLDALDHLARGLAALGEGARQRSPNPRQWSREDLKAIIAGQMATRFAALLGLSSREGRDRLAQGGYTALSLESVRRIADLLLDMVGDVVNYAVLNPPQGQAAQDQLISVRTPLLASLTQRPILDVRRAPAVTPIVGLETAPAGSATTTQTSAPLGSAGDEEKRLIEGERIIETRIKRAFEAARATADVSGIHSATSIRVPTSAPSRRAMGGVLYAAGFYLATTFMPLVTMMRYLRERFRGSWGAGRSINPAFQAMARESRLSLMAHYSRPASLALGVALLHALLCGVGVHALQYGDVALSYDCNPQSDQFLEARMMIRARNENDISSNVYEIGLASPRPAALIRTLASIVFAGAAPFIQEPLMGTEPEGDNQTYMGIADAARSALGRMTSAAIAQFPVSAVNPYIGEWGNLLYNSAKHLSHAAHATLTSLRGGDMDYETLHLLGLGNFPIQFQYAGRAKYDYKDYTHWLLGDLVRLTLRGLANFMSPIGVSGALRNDTENPALQWLRFVSGSLGADVPIKITPAAIALAKGKVTTFARDSERKHGIIMQGVTSLDEMATRIHMHGPYLAMDPSNKEFTIFVRTDGTQVDVRHEPQHWFYEEAQARARQDVSQTANIVTTALYVKAIRNGDAQGLINTKNERRADSLRNTPADPSLISSPMKRIVYTSGLGVGWNQGGPIMTEDARRQLGVRVSFTQSLANIAYITDQLAGYDGRARIIYEKDGHREHYLPIHALRVMTHGVWTLMENDTRQKVLEMFEPRDYTTVSAVLRALSNTHYVTSLPDLGPVSPRWSYNASAPGVVAPVVSGVVNGEQIRYTDEDAFRLYSMGRGAAAGHLYRSVRAMDIAILGDTNATNLQGLTMDNPGAQEAMVREGVGRRSGQTIRPYAVLKNGTRKVALYIVNASSQSPREGGSDTAKESDYVIYARYEDTETGDRFAAPLMAVSKSRKQPQLIYAIPHVDGIPLDRQDLIAAYRKLAEFALNGSAENLSDIKAGLMKLLMSVDYHPGSMSMIELDISKVPGRSTPHGKLGHILEYLPLGAIVFRTNPASTEQTVPLVALGIRALLQSVQDKKIEGKLGGDPYKDPSALHRLLRHVYEVPQYGNRITVLVSGHRGLSSYQDFYLPYTLQEYQKRAAVLVAEGTIRHNTPAAEAVQRGFMALGDMIVMMPYYAQNTRNAYTGFGRLDTSAGQ